MTDTWRLIRDGALPGARNMARDVAMLEAVAHGEAPPTLRLYGWDPPCLSLGRHQGLEAADLASAAPTASTWCGGRPAAAPSSTTSS